MMSVLCVTAVALAVALAACGKSTGPAPSVDSLSISPPNLLLRTGQSVQLNAVLTRNNDTLPSPTVRWSSENVDVATVDSTGRIVAIGCCTTNIVARLAALRAQTMVIVLEPSCGPLSMSPASVVMRIGDTLRARPVITCRDFNPRFVWRSTHPGIVAVSDSGILTALAQGQAAIFARLHYDTALYAAMAATVVP